MKSLAVAAVLVSLIVAVVAPAQVPEHPFSVSLSGGCTWFSPADLNSFIKSSVPEIKGGMTFGADIGYYVMPQLSLHLGVGYIRGSSEGNVKVTGTTGPAVIESAEASYSATSIPIYLGVQYHFIVAEKFTIAPGAFVEVHPATAKFKLEATAVSQGTEETRSKTGIGVRLSVAPQFSLTQTLAVGLDFGYRFAKVDYMNGGQGFLPGALSLDLSGPYAMGGLILRL